MVVIALFILLLIDTLDKLCFSPVFLGIHILMLNFYMISTYFFREISEIILTFVGVIALFASFAEARVQVT